MHSRHLKTFAALFFGATSLAAVAHTGQDGGLHDLVFTDGLLHPLTGTDHLAAMLAVGVWSALSATFLRHLVAAPLAFAGMLLAGAVAGQAGFTLPAVEPMIAASLLVLGLLLASRATLPAALGASLAGVFAVFHGLAHGTKLAGSTQAFPPLAGMMAATLALHLAGIGIGLALRARSAWWPRAAGGLVALLGGAFLLQLI
jgi:urease accessory protein